MIFKNNCYRGKKRNRAISCGLFDALYKWEKGTKPSDLNDYFRFKAAGRMRHICAVMTSLNVSFITRSLKAI